MTAYRAASAAALLLIAVAAPAEPPEKSGLPPEGSTAGVPVGVPVGPLPNRLAQTIINPDEGNQAASNEGKHLFQTMNCAYCHGFGAPGLMGPSLADKYWRYGGTPAEVFKSIYEGRSKGMPAYGQALPPATIWKIVTYLQSLGGMTQPDSYQAAIQGDTPNERETSVPKEVAGDSSAGVKTPP